MDSVFQTARYQIWFGTEARFKELLQTSLARNTASHPLDAADLLNTAVNRFKQYPNFLTLLLEAGYPLNLPDRSGETAFMAAAGYGMVDAMQLLLAAGADPHWTNELGANAASMTLVCRNPHCSWCERLIEAHAIVTQLTVRFNPESEDAAKRIFEAGRERHTWHLIPVMETLGVPRDPLGWTAFMNGIATGSAVAAEVEQLSLSDLTHRDTRDRSPFILAVMADRIDLAKALVQRGVTGDLHGSKGTRALHLATVNGATKIMDWLLSLDISIEARNEDLETPLMLAVDFREIEAVDYLLKNGADIHARNENGDQAIHMAWGAELMRLLIEAGADVRSEDNNGYQAIHDTIDMEHITILLEAGADVNAISGGGSWILNDIAGQGDAEGLSLLLSRGAEPDLTSANGNTALFNAVRSDSLTCVQLLLEAGADINAADTDGWTCLKGVKSLVMAEYLLQHGADPALADSASLTHEWIPPEVQIVFESHLLKNRDRKTGTGIKS